MSTALASPFYDLDNLLQALKRSQQEQQHLSSLAPMTQTAQTGLPLPLERKVVGSPLANRQRPCSPPPRSMADLTKSYLTHLPPTSNQISHNNLLNSLQQQQPQPPQMPLHRKLDRSMSEPVGERPSKNSNINPSRYKTEMCRPFEESGHCKYGDKCQFAHGQHELRNLARHPKYKTELCRTFHTIGFCPYGPRCHFIHNEDERKLNYIIQQKQQQAVQQATQQVVQHTLLQQQQQKAVSRPEHSHHKLLSCLSLPAGSGRDSLGSTADSPPDSVTSESPQSLSPTLGFDLEVFGSSGHQLGSTALTPPPSYHPHEFTSTRAPHVTTSPVPVMSPLNVNTDPFASLTAGLVAALASTSTSSHDSSPCDSFGTPPSPPDSVNGDDDSRPLRLPIFSRFSED